MTGGLEGLLAKTEGLRSMEVVTSFVGACRSVERRGSRGSFVLVTLPVFSSDSILTSGGLGLVSQDEGVLASVMLWWKTFLLTLPSQLEIWGEGESLSFLPV